MANSTNKRKRSSLDQGANTSHSPAGQSTFSHVSPSTSTGQNYTQYLKNAGEGDITLAEALAQHNAGEPQQAHDAAIGNGQSATDTASAALHYSMTVPSTTESTFIAQASNENAERDSEPNFDIDAASGAATSAPSTFTEYTGLEPFKEGERSAHHQTASAPVPVGQGSPSGPKLAVGSDEWHKLRRDNHKQVERRRRETINEGINELAKIVPGNEKNKGSILASAVQFITQLKENETQNIEKWTLEKLLTEQAIAELSGTCDKLKDELKNASIECEAWRAMGRRLDCEPNEIDQRGAGKDADDD